MTLPVVLTAEAEADLDEASQWYEQRSAGLGGDLVGRVRETLAQIAITPLLYPQVHAGIRRASVRRFPYGVFYRPGSNRVEVIAIFHDRRDPAAVKRRG
jgi:plasmid stabilization system protein ParE